MARRSIWKGAITFGMVSIPSKLYSATDDARINLHQYHKSCGSRISMPKYCPNCEQMLDAADITKGYEVGEGYVPLTEQDFATLPLKSVKQIEVVEFVPDSQLDSRWYEKSYYIGVDGAGHKAYRLLMLAMEQAGMVAVAKLAYREREHLCIIRSHDGVLLLQNLLYADQIRDYADLRPHEYAISDKEMELARALIKAMTVSEFDHSKYHDEYRHALEQLIEAKLAGEVLPVPDEGQKAPVEDVAAALLASLDMVGKGEPEPAEVGKGKKAPAEEKEASLF